MSFFSAVVVTVSDRSYRGQRPDEAGPLVAELLREAGYTVVRTALVPDEQSQIAHILEEIADSGTVDLLVTTGGTGFSPRDVTPEATLSVCDRLAPGLPEAMRYASLQITPRAMLSPGSGRYSGRDADCEPPRLSQGCSGEFGGRSSHTFPRTGDALRPERGLCGQRQLTKAPPVLTGGAFRLRLWSHQPHRAESIGITCFFRERILGKNAQFPWSPLILNACWMVSSSPVNRSCVPSSSTSVIIKITVSRDCSFRIRFITWRNSAFLSNRRSESIHVTCPTAKSWPAM